MIGDQLTYLKAPFYNSNFSKPNGSANPFEKAQLNNNKLRCTEMAQDSRSWRNVLPNTIGPSKPEHPVETSAKSSVGSPDAPAPKAPVFTPVLATASTNGLFQQFMKTYLENQNQAQTPAPVQIKP